MNSNENAGIFIRKLEELIPLFEGVDLDPLTPKQIKQMNAWKALLRDESSKGSSRTRTHVRKHAKRFAVKVKSTAGLEPLFLSILTYSISALPKILFVGFYDKLQEWSQTVQFPGLLRVLARDLWNEQDQGVRPQIRKGGDLVKKKTLAGDVASTSCKFLAFDFDIKLTY